MAQSISQPPRNLEAERVCQTFSGHSRRSRSREKDDSRGPTLARHRSLAFEIEVWGGGLRLSRFGFRVLNPTAALSPALEGCVCFVEKLHPSKTVGAT